MAEKIIVTPLKNPPRPGLVDEIKAEGAYVHIERMASDHYWLNINGETFNLRGITTAKHKRVYLDLTRT